MQAIMETIFDIVYLIGVISMGVIMCVNSKQNYNFRLFGIMAVLLGCGDAFHLIPRVYSLLTDSMDKNVAMLGFGKLVTSITMTIFYVILYHFWKSRYQIAVKTPLTAAIYGLAIVRVALCLFPQNEWFSANASFNWGIYRNIPFAILGAVIVWMFVSEAERRRDRQFQYAWLAVLFSFAFYVPVVLWADTIPIIGMLMIPKTLCYVWLVFMGFNEFRNIQHNNSVLRSKNFSR